MLWICRYSDCPYIVDGCYLTFQVIVGLQWLTLLLIRSSFELNDLFHLSYLTLFLSSQHFMTVLTIYRKNI